MKRTALLVFCILVSEAAVFCQSRVEFGEVSFEELQMTQYEADSSAEAVILSDVGRLNGNDLTFTRHIRVKILKKSGVSWGNWVFNTPTQSDFKVLVYNLVAGKIVEETANRNTIYKEKVVDDFEVYKVFAPSVNVGSVIDIKYSFRGVPFEWRFQERIPVVYSDLTLEQTVGITFSKTFFGFHPIETLSPSHWRAVNVPAFHFEPYLNDYRNYITKFEIQLETMRWFGYFLEFNTSWKKIIGNLDDHPRFGAVIRGSGFLDAVAEEIKSKHQSTEDRIEAAFECVRKNIKWNGTKSLFASLDGKKHFQVTHSGNSAEINLLLISLLNKMDITTYPVVQSTRDNGLLIQYAPAYNKLNYVFAFVQHENILMYLDATSENLKPGILPPYCLNGQGLLVKKNTEQWVTLNTRYSDSKRQYIEVNIDQDGMVKAKLRQDFQDYGYVNWADELKANNEDPDIMKDNYQKNNPEVRISSYEIKQKDARTLTGKEYMEVDLSNSLIDAGNELVFNPYVLFDYVKNPLQSEERKYPIDMACPKELHTTIVIQLPSNLSTKMSSYSQKLTTLDGAGTFTYAIGSNANSIQLRSTLKINREIFDEVEYHELRNFFSEVIKLVNTPIQLLKKT